MEVTLIPSAPDPLNFPCPFAATTVPTTWAPRGKTVAPPAVLTDCARTPVNPSPTLLWLALNCSVTVTTTAAPAGAVNLTGAGGGGGASATGAGAGAAGATAGAGLGAAAEPAELAGGAAGAAGPSGLELCAGAPAGAGAGVELLHPPRRSVAERMKLAAKTRDLSRMG